MITDQIEGLRTVGVLKIIEEEIFTLKCAKYRDVQLLFEWTSQTEQQRVGKIDHVGRRLIFHPINKLEDLLALKTVFTFQDGHRHLAQHLWIRGDRPPRCKTQNRFRIP